MILGHYLGGYAGGKRTAFVSIEEAKSKCLTGNHHMIREINIGCIEISKTNIVNIKFIITVNNCKGLTKEKRSGQWTLRASEIPRKSPTGEISMLRSCFGNY